MAEIGTATVKITPVIDEDALSQVDTAVREAVADALRKVADSLVAKPTGKAVEPEQRYYVEKINGIWGVRDREREGEWAAWDRFDDAEGDARTGARDLNAGADRDLYEWSAPGLF